MSPKNRYPKRDYRQSFNSDNYGHIISLVSTHQAPIKLEPNRGWTICCAAGKGFILQHRQEIDRHIDIVRKYNKRQPRTTYFPIVWSSMDNIKYNRVFYYLSLSQARTLSRWRSVEEMTIRCKTFFNFIYV